MKNNRLKECREKAGLSQVALARKAKIASTNLSAIENGRLSPWPKAKRGLAKALKIPLEELFPES